MEPSNRKVVIALGSALGLALLAIAFLLGRLTAVPAVGSLAAPPVASSAPVTGSATAEPLAAPASSFPSPSDALSSSNPSPGLGASTPEIAPANAASVAAASVPTERGQIAAYFAQLERLEDMGAGDPQAFASSMMQSLSSGDFSGFDELLAKARNQKQRLQVMTPPAACVEHHRLALALSGDSVTMLERLKAALMKGDSMALVGIASEGRTLETQANQLKSLAEKIKRQAGV